MRGWVMDNFTPVSAAIGGALIGLSAVLLMVFTGRIAGISGIFAGLINPQTTDCAWRAAFIGGLVAAPLTAALLDHTVPTPRMPGSYIVVVIGGLLVGFGTRLGSGCTSGHGICGIARLSPRSIVATGVFMMAAIIVVALTHHVFGGYASLVCGFVFGCGLVVSGMIQPAKVLGFLDFFGIPSSAWDPSLAVVMAAALAVAGLGYALLGTRPPLFERQSLWPTKKDIDSSLLSGALLFGIGWGLVGLCPGPAIVNLSTLSLPVIVFVIAMATGMLAHDLWATTAAGAIRRSLISPTVADG